MRTRRAVARVRDSSKTCFRDVGKSWDSGTEFDRFSIEVGPPAARRQIRSYDIRGEFAGSRSERTAVREKLERE